MPENTVNRDPLVHLIGAMSDDPDRYITDMESAGQRQLVESADVPSNMRDSQSDFEALGFVFGEPYQHDPMFRPATFPVGWKREASDHPLWSYILDQHGRRRVSIFYKAAWYDRQAFMYLDTPSRG